MPREPIPLLREGGFLEAEKMFVLCFEIWLLLHLKDINEYDEVEKHRLLINEKISHSKNYIDKVLGEIQGRGHNKTPNPSVYLPIFAGNKNYFASTHRGFSLASQTF